MTYKYQTDETITWCPGCPNHMIMASAQKAMDSLVKKGKAKKESFAMGVGVGCHAKIFDYLNINGLYGLHGRTIPTISGIKLGNPNLNVIGFAGDGDTYSEGMAHFIHAARFNMDITLVVHDNQSFSLTTGQATPTSQLGYKSKAEPLGEFNEPFNPVRLALASGASFVARCNARDIEHTAKVIEKAVMHKGFSFVEVIQDCLIFNKAINNKDKMMYKLSDKKRSWGEAMKLANQWDYNLGKGKIPLGIFYQDKKKKAFDEKWPQLQLLKKKKVSWKGLRR